MRDIADPRRDSIIAAFVALAGTLLLASRKPDAFLAAQFWAEDGIVWFRQAHDIGWASLLQPQNGYFQTVSKIAGNVAQWVPLVHAPLAFALIALAFKILPVMLLNGARGRELLPSTAIRLLLSFLYAAHPYSWEVFLNVTNIHWHLALAALILLCFDRWDGVAQKAGDVAIVLLSGLSGVFALFLAPIAVWRWRRNRNTRAGTLAAILVAAAAIQAVVLVATGDQTRTAAGLGASWEGFFRILGGQVAAASLLGARWTDLYGSAWWQANAALPVLLSIGLLALLARAFVLGGPALRALLLLSAMVLTTALLRPQISTSQAQWPLFARPDVGGRYVFLPILAVYASLVWMAAADRRAALRWIARGLVAVVLCVAIAPSWRVRPYDDVGFRERAAAFEQAAPGDVVDIPINPAGWSFPLKKK